MLPRLLVLGSGENSNPVPLSSWFSTSRTMPGSVRTHCSSSFTSIMFLMYFEKSMTID